MRVWLMAGVAASTLAVLALAQESTVDRTEGGRYALEQTEDGFLRLDRRTGRVSSCTESASGNWACRAAADDRAVLEAEIERLTERVDRLEEQLAAAGSDDGRVLDLPTRKEVDEMMGFMEDVMGRFKSMVDRLNEDTPKMDRPPEEVPNPDRT